MFIKLITLATLFYVAFLFYFNTKTLVEMIKFANQKRKERNMSKWLMCAMMLDIKVFRISLYISIISMTCVGILLIMLFM